MLSASLGAVAVAACSIYDASLLLPAAAVVSDAGPPDVAAADADAGPRCPHATLPGKPTGEDGEQDLSLTLAFSEVSFGIGDAGPAGTQGLDLDLTCSCPGAPSCIAPVGASPACDGPLGQDNALKPVFERFTAFNQDSLAGTFRAGRSSLLLFVSRYNGGLNDRLVSVGLAVSGGIEGARFPDAGPKDPAFDGSDLWTVDPDSVVGGNDALLAGASCQDKPCVPVIADTAAYVSNGVLVARFGALPAAKRAFPGQLVFDLEHASIRAKITKVGNTYQLTEGELTGRWPAERLLHNITGLENPFGGSVCKGSAVYGQVKAAFCAAVDLAPDPASDNQGKACTALSTVVAFNGTQARAGRVARSVEEPKCPDEADTCATP
jgi:hypothetical protein